MSRLKRFLQNRPSDEGMSLVEVVVAMMVFAVISVGVIAALATITRMTTDSRARAVASNLAVTELDSARTMDPFEITNDTYTVEMSGRTYTVVRSTSWVDTAGTDVACGTGTGVMQSKRVNVTVTWGGMLTTTQPVRSDTLVSPEGRINDPNLGTIRISALAANGAGSAGVGVTISVVTGGKALAEQPDNTDSDGCSYALKVYPGTYKVAINRGNSVDSAQVASPSTNVTVTAGGSVAAQFQYDYAATFSLAYASNYGGTTPKFPSSLDTSFVSTYGTYLDPVRKAQISLHPITSGYAGIAGKFVAPSPSGSGGCISVDPGAWQEATVNSVALAAGERTPAAAEPNGQATMNIPMGVVTVNQSGNYTLTAESATAPAAAADPGCSIPMSYSFGGVSGAQTIALPFGSWTLYATSGKNKTAIAASSVTPLTSAPGLTSGTGTVITLDPRPAK